MKGAPVFDGETNMISHINPPKANFVGPFEGRGYPILG